MEIALAILIRVALAALFMGLAVKGTQVSFLFLVTPRALMSERLQRNTPLHVAACTGSMLLMFASVWMVYMAAWALVLPGGIIPTFVSPFDPSIR